MKKTLFYAMLFFSSTLRAEPVQNLAKYSYFCFAINKSISYTGTCFLYQKNNQIFVVSNYHVFYAADLLGEKQVMHVDTLRIRYISTKTNKPKFYKIVNDTDHITFFKHYNSPDLMAKEIKDIPTDMPLNLINDLMEPAYFGRQPDSVMFIGYPAVFTKVTGPEQVEVQRCFLKGDFENCATKFTNENQEAINNQTSSSAVNRKINNSEFEIGIASLPGFSGSPVFGRFIKDGQEHYVFIGVVFASNLGNNFSMAIKGKVFYDFIKNLSAQVD